jgi:hypothetical protein
MNARQVTQEYRNRQKFSVYILKIIFDKISPVESRSSAHYWILLAV